MIVFDRVADRDTQRNFEKLAQLVLDTGGVTANVRFGTEDITWPGGSVSSNTSTVPHGLDRAPAVLFVQPTSGGGFHEAVIGPSGTTDMDIQLRRADGVTPGAGTTLTVYWLVLG